MRARRRVLVSLACALGATLASTAIPRTRLEVQDWDCPPAPASCARPVDVRGFPLAYISDYHGISPVGRASLVSAALGEDHFHPAAFFLDLAVYFALAVAVAGIVTALAARASR